MVRCSRQDSNVSTDATATLAGKLADIFPPQLRPLVREALSAATSDGPEALPNLLVLLAEAMAQRKAVRLRFALPAGSGLPNEPILEPEVLLPYADSWYLIGHCRQRNRVLMVCLDNLESVAVSA